MTGSRLDAFACVLEKEGYNIWTALWLKENQRVNCQSFCGFICLQQQTSLL
jgi:hypothetical protein